MFTSFTFFFDIMLGPQFLSCDVIYGLVASSSSYNAYDIIESQFASRPISFYMLIQGNTKLWQQKHMYCKYNDRSNRR